MNKFKIFKQLKSDFMKAYIYIYEKKYLFKNHEIKYLWVNNKSDKLCVVFSGFPELGKFATYNYVRTLRKNRKFSYLFILDDMVNIPTGGSYYLGAKGDYWAIDGIKELISYYTKKINMTLLVTTGSSKGGTSALLYGALLGANAIIAGACQYKIGTYLTHPYHINSLRELTGQYDVKPTEIDYLDQIVSEALRKNEKKSTTEIFLHYSKQEHTYLGHIQYLINDLESLGYKVHHDVKDYTNHGDVGLYFPEFLLQSLDVIIC